MRRRWTILVVTAAVLSVGAFVPHPAAHPDPAFDRGATAAWLSIRKLTTAASLLHTTAHPDDEHGGMLALMSHGLGVRTALATLTRGEAGDNAIGPELFDGLGLIRTEELRVAGRYYGLDEQYFTTVADYGYSKRLDEAIELWGREHVVRDLVAIIRMSRPLVVVSRFQGTARDGHGQHQAAGLLTQEAFTRAADPEAFPEQRGEGLRPWRALKLYVGGVRADEPWHVQVDSGEYDPVLGVTYENLARRGLSFQRSQNAGRFVPADGAVPRYYQRVVTEGPAPDRETGFFDGLDVTLPGVARAAGGGVDPAVMAGLADVQRLADEALGAFSFTDPAASAPGLARGLRRARASLDQLGDGEPAIAQLLRIKVRQFEVAISNVLGVEFSAVAQTSPHGDDRVPAAPETFGPVVPGQAFAIRMAFRNPSSIPLEPRFSGAVAGEPLSVATPAGEPVVADSRVQLVPVTVPEDAEPTRPHFGRASPSAARYVVSDPVSRYLPSAGPVGQARATYEVDGVEVTTGAVVRRLEADPPYGQVAVELNVTVPLSVTLSPQQAVVSLEAAHRTLTMRVDLLNHMEGASSGSVRLALPAEWTAAPDTVPFSFSRAGERLTVLFTVTIPSITPRGGRIEAVATVNGVEFSQGYRAIRHRDLEPAYLYADAVTRVRAVDVRIVPDLRVGYVMGVGDEVPTAIAQLGAAVELLDGAMLAEGDLQGFDTIVLGTRAYAVREDLHRHNERLLAYVRDGGNLVVLYNTPELVPSALAPYPGQLPRDAEEVSEEDAPVTILAPAARVLQWPNQIGGEDFEGWIEQRGSKFWSDWDAAYTPIVESHDVGQPPQRGGWLQARVGEGSYTYFAYALHRQLRFGVPGAYRLLANLLSLGREP